MEHKKEEEVKYKSLANCLIFENHGKQGDEPDYRGKGTLNNNEMFISLWKKTDKNKREYYSMNIQIQDIT